MRIQRTVVVVSAAVVLLVAWAARAIRQVLPLLERAAMTRDQRTEVIEILERLP